MSQQTGNKAQAQIRNIYPIHQGVDELYGRSKMLGAKKNASFSMFLDHVLVGYVRLYFHSSIFIHNIKIIFS